MSSINVEKPRLIIRPWVWDKMMFFARNKEGLECSGLGIVEFQGTDFVISEMFMVKQVNTSTETEMDADSIGKAMYEHRNAKGLIKWHWHSHVNMSVFWSADDREMIKKNSSQGWFIHTVMNLKHEKRSCIAQQRPFPFFIDEIETIVESPPYSDEQYAAWNDEYSRNVSEKHTQWVTPNDWQKEREEARAKATAPVSLPESVSYGDSIDRHETNDSVGNSTAQEVSDSSDADVMTSEGVMKHLADRLAKLKTAEASLESLALQNPSSIEIHNQWYDVMGQVEECQDLIDRMKEHIQDAAERALVASEGLSV